MEKLKRVLFKLLFPGTAVVVICTLAAAAALVWAFAIAPEGHPLTYAAYVLSFYALVILCANAVPIVRRGRSWAKSNKYVGRYLEDVPFKVSVSLYGSLAVNALYALLNALYSVMYVSAWFATLAAYYLMLAVIRFLLVRYAHIHGIGSNMAAEWRRYRLCGALLVPLGIVLVGEVILLLHEDGSFSYAGTLIYAMAAYTFYTITMAIINVVRYRRYNNPVMSSARVMSLASAAVSMLALEVAMLTQFGAEDEINFRRIMIILSGCAVFVLMVGTGIYMTVHSSRALRESEGGNDNG